MKKSFISICIAARAVLAVRAFVPHAVGRALLHGERLS